MANKMKWLRTYLLVFGVANVLSSWAVPLFFGDSLLWHPRNLPTDLMVGSLYLPMGIIMVCIAKSPQRQKGFIDFLVISNILHAGVMVVFAQRPNHIYLDASFIGLTGVLPLIFYPWGLKTFLKYGRMPG